MRSIVKLLHALRRDERGNVLMITGLMLFVLLAMGGAGIDFGRQQLMRIKLQQASDAAALAGGLSKDDGASTAMRYFNLNFPETYMGVSRPTPRIGAGGSVTVAADAELPSYFMRFVSPQNARLQSGGSSTVDATVSESGSKYDLLLVMDVSGSMVTDDAGSTNMLEADPATRAEARTTCVPYIMDTYRYSRKAAEDRCRNNYFATIGANRMNAMRYAASYITDQLIGPGGNRDNRVGAITWSHILNGSEDMTADAARIHAFLGKMMAEGDTNSAVGMQRAQEMTRDFRQGYVQAVVLITDGQNNAVASDANTLRICSAIKQADVLVYTIAFGKAVSDNNRVQQFLSDCASENPEGGRYFFIAPDSQSLTGVFSSILTSIRKVRIVQ